MESDSAIANDIRDFILCQPQERQAVLIHRLAILVVNDRGGPSEWLIGWINDDHHHSWSNDDE